MNVADWQKRYNDYPSFFKTLFRDRVQKLSIDGGFTCPNRDGRKGTGGCTFCIGERDQNKGRYPAAYGAQCQWRADRGDDDACR